VQEILDDPFIMSAAIATLLPLVTALVLTGALGLIASPRAAGFVIVIAFIAVHLVVFGWPIVLPRSSLQKIVYIAVAGLVLGVVLDRRAAGLPALIWSAVIVAWLGWQQLIGMEPVDLVRIVLLWLAGAFMFDRLLVLPTADIAAPIMLLVAALGTSLIAFLGYAESLSQLAAALAAGAGGFLLWNWPKRRFVFGAGAVLSAATALFAVATTIMLFTRSSILAMAILLAVFLTSSLRTRIPLGSRPVLGPVVLALVGMLPVLIAIAVAVLSASPTNS
jgi:hypothetical protein